MVLHDVKQSHKRTNKNRIVLSLSFLPILIKPVNQMRERLSKLIDLLFFGIVTWISTLRSSSRVRAF